MPHKEERKLCNAYKEYIDSLCVKYNVKKLLAGTVPLVEALQPEKKELINPLMKFGYCPAATTPTYTCCLLYTSPSPRDRSLSRMPSSA